jgi:hypothetical protein
MEYDLDHLRQYSVFIFKGQCVIEECNLFAFLVLFDGIDFIIFYGLGHHGHSHIFALNGLLIGWTLLFGNLLLVCARFDILTVALARIQVF